MSAEPQAWTVMTAPSGKVTGPSVGSGVEGGSEAAPLGSEEVAELGATLTRGVGDDEVSATPPLPPSSVASAAPTPRASTPSRMKPMIGSAPEPLRPPPSSAG